MQRATISCQDSLKDGRQIGALVAHVYLTLGQCRLETLRFVAQCGDEDKVHLHTRVLQLDKRDRLQGWHAQHSTV